MFGRRNYEGFVDYWDSFDPAEPSAKATEIEIAVIFKSLPRVVVSRSLDHVPANTILIGDDIAGELTKLKKRPGGDLLLVCGPELLAQLVDLDLVDEYWVVVHPIVLGRGIALFGQLRRKLQMNLVSTQVFQSGGVLHRYLDDMLQLNRDPA